MLVELKTLRPNPLRDFKIDPLDAARVEDLTKSITEDGFWGGIACRRLKTGEIQVAAGWHRVQAALAAHIKTADVFVADSMSDAEMVRVYCRENATQRGNSGTAQAGSIASAVHILAKMLMVGNLTGFPGRFTKRSIEVATGNMTKGDGIGARFIEELLSGIPGITRNVIDQQLLILKSSGEYARIVREVNEEIEEENREAFARLKKAEEEQRKAEAAAAKAVEEKKAADVRAKAAKEEADHKRAVTAQQRAEEEAKLAAKRQREADEAMQQFEALKKTRDTSEAATKTASRTPITFDQVGVQKSLTVASHVTAFKNIVTAVGVQPYVKVEQQAKLARELVAEFQEGQKEGYKDSKEGFVKFMHDHIIDLARYGRAERTRLTKEEQEARERENLVVRYRRLVDEFSVALRTLIRVGADLSEMDKKWPKGVQKPISLQLRNDSKLAKSIIDQLAKKWI